MSRSVLISDKLISAEKCFIRLRLRLLSVCVSVVLRKRPLVWKSHSDRCYNVSVRHTCCVVSDFTPESLCITSVLGVFAKLRKATVSFIMSVRPSAWNNSAPTGQILIQFYVWAFFFKNASREFKFNKNPSKTTGTFHEDVFTYMKVSCWITLRMRNISSKSCRENQNTHFMFSHFFPPKSCRLWDNVEKYGGAREAADDNIIAKGSNRLHTLH